MKLALVVAGLLFCGSALAQEGTPQKPPSPVVEPAVPVAQDILSCHVAGHPQAVCWWSDPTAHECFTYPSASPKGYPARHYFAGATLCWGGDERFFSVIGTADAQR